MTDWIARRTYDAEMHDGSILPLKILIGRPFEVAEFDEWHCEYKIDASFHTYEHTIMHSDGISAIMAILLVLQGHFVAIQREHNCKISLYGSQGWNLSIKELD
jgi:hypothetical protein